MMYLIKDRSRWYVVGCQSYDQIKHNYAQSGWLGPHPPVVTSAVRRAVRKTLPSCLSDEYGTVVGSSCNNGRVKLARTVLDCLTNGLFVASIQDANIAFRREGQNSRCYN